MKTQLFALNQLPPECFEQAKIQIIQILRSDSSLIDTLTPDELDQILNDDKSTSYSHVSYHEGTETISGVILAREGQESIFNKVQGNIVTLEKLVVDSSFRKKGLGKKLVQQMAAVAVARRQEEIRLVVYKSNDDALAFYSKMGFEYVNKEQDASENSWLIAAKPYSLVGSF